MSSWKTKQTASKTQDSLCLEFFSVTPQSFVHFELCPSWVCEVSESVKPKSQVLGLVWEGELYYLPLRLFCSQQVSLCSQLTGCIFNLVNWFGCMANTAENPRRQVTLEKAFQDSRQLFKHCFSCVSGGKTVVNRIAEYTSLKSEPAASNHCKRKPWDPHSSDHATREWVCSTYLVIRTGPGEPAPRGHPLVYTLPHFSGRIPLFSGTKKPREQLGQDVSTMVLMGTNSWKPWGGGGGASVSQCREWHSWMGSMKWRGVSDTWVTYGSHHGIGGRIPTADSCRPRNSCAHRPAASSLTPNPGTSLWLPLCPSWILPSLLRL